jgi:sulfur-carrier protein
VACVRVRGALKQLAGGCSEHQLDGGTVAELLTRLEQAHPAVCGWVLDERRVIRRHINVYVNGERGDESTVVRESDRVDVVPAITGGMV